MKLIRKDKKIAAKAMSTAYTKMWITNTKFDYKNDFHNKINYVVIVDVFK